MIDNLDPGRYTLSATRNGYVWAAYVQQGQSRDGCELSNWHPALRIRDLVVKLPVQGVVTGRVVDEDGEPLELGYRSTGAAGAGGSHARRVRTGRFRGRRR